MKLINDEIWFPKNNKMNLIKHDDDDYSLMDGEKIVANTITSLTRYILDIDQINTLLPIDDDDEFEIESTIFRYDSLGGAKLVMNLKRNLKTIRNLKINDILNPGNNI